MQGWTPKREGSLNAIYTKKHTYALDKTNGKPLWGGGLLYQGVHMHLHNYVLD